MFFKPNYFYFIIFIITISSCEKIESPVNSENMNSPNKEFWADNTDQNNPEIYGTYFLDINRPLFKNQFIGEYQASGCIYSVFEYSQGGIEINTSNCNNVVGNIINEISIDQLPNEGLYRIPLDYGYSDLAQTNAGYYGSITLLNENEESISFELTDDDRIIRYINESGTASYAQLPWGQSLSSIRLDYINNKIEFWGEAQFGYDIYFTTNLDINNISKVRIGNGDPANWYIKEFIIQKFE